MRSFILALVVTTGTASVGYAQSAVLDRLPPDRFDVVPPSARVRGTPGNLTIRQAPCRALPMAGVRRRIIDVAVQEWGFFGFTVVDQTRVGTTDDQRRVGTNDQRSSRRRRRPRLSPAESARVAGSIAGYWTVTPEGSWIIDAQNGEWQGPRGLAARWRYPWSAAFVSWVMCEGGLGDASQFQRAVAHHSYIDQAIRARDNGAARAAFTAYDTGDAQIVPGDLLCSARRPAYRTIAERRRQMGDGARTHCDIVVTVDAQRSRILAIGGNVRGAVSLKLLPATREPGQYLRPVAGAIFAHLKLRAEPIEEDALDRSPTMRALACEQGVQVIDRLAAANVVAPAGNPSRCG